MNGTGFSPPAAEMAEINRMQYQIEYTEAISQKMRVPEKLKVASNSAESDTKNQFHMPVSGVMMQVPERILVSGHSEEASFSRPPDLDLIQTTPFEPLALKTPPRVLTLSERPLDFLDLERPTPHSDEPRSIGRQKRERSVSENSTRQNGQLVRHDSTPTPSAHTGPLCPAPSPPVEGADLFSARGILSLIQTSTRRAYQQVIDVLDENRRYGGPSLDSTLEGNLDDMTLVDATSLRRQIIKLNRRLLLLEEENKERVKREMVMYSITVAFWLLNSWFWFRR
ncbi:mitochondrial fission factor isoform X2 [Bombina bombina]|uniref:mitochondrial fission factor isoform X2 n=1 Tax=Bombina bombina TaxID=8345 RepID=UPI00235B0FEC|nr:mitochondrial fission factor isoform X2 [Bombina bombina]